MSTPHDGVGSIEAPWFVEQAVELRSPRQGRLERGRSHHFDLRIPGASAAYVKASGSVTTLQRTGYDTFVGDCTVYTDDTTIFADFGMSEGYAEGLVRFEVR